MGAVEQLVFSDNYSDYCVDSVLCRELENSNGMIFKICAFAAFI